MKDIHLKTILTGRYASGQKTFCKKLKEEGLVIENYHDPYNNLATNFDNTDVIVIRPDLIKSFAENHPDTTFRLIYMTADYNQRIAQFDAVTDAAEIEELNAEENDLQYDYFEHDFKNGKIDIKNISCTAEIEHDFNDPTTIDKYVGFVITENRRHNNMMVMLKTLCDNKSVSMNENGDILVAMTDNDGNDYTEPMTPSMFAETVIHSDTGLATITREWLRLIDL